MINQATLLGRVGNKDIKQLRNGGEVTVLSIATSKRYKDAQGNKQEQTTWHNVSCFSKLSELASKYVHVGDLVFIQGEIQNKKIESGEKSGQYMYSIHANDIKFIPNGNSASMEKSKNL
jgi:single-strand DNA-binding protein